MSTPQLNTIDCAHTSSPTYSYGPSLLLESIESEPSPPPLYEIKASRPWWLQSAEKLDTVDEEAQHGFWGASPPFHSYDKISPIHRGGWCYDHGFWSFLSILISISCVLFVAIDLDLNHYAGVAHWVVHGDAHAVKTTHQMQFCLMTLSHGTSSPRSWRYMPPANLENCATKIVTLFASSSEQQQLRLNDEVIIGDSRTFTAKHKEDGKSIHDEILEELGDDIAEEGKLRRLIPGTAL
ncbi:hypothetical protein P153DRAFT_380534 [Dothidotthia symphoricarpi CBS 119687]|uniref:Uncharacterized protein n=1 Tax=Dothidotthia symphoricarpi CBS 119687 TaxID=1392245 RepID=A0A6A6ARW1_9PLEO|nr:uncharacterized protein P153DRAFT_380534 [Dothidotthia symphoricarpi CBS 119687]KAF2134722.1 hypothetical protein P153DRAFT_380534 [Dothidotthia symphoricarpi CBS 119687]